MTLALRRERIAAAQLPALAALLAAEALPTSDIGEPGRLFWRFRLPGGSDIGFGGLELYGTDTLLRSVAVVPARRGQGYGRAIVAALLDAAAARSAERVFLLTTGAAAFFAALGFAPLPRDAVPQAIGATREFAALCPVTAVCMAKTLAPGA